MPHIRARTLENASHPTRCTLCAFFRLLARPQTRGSARASIVLQRPKPLPGSERLGTGPGPPLSRLQGAHTASEGQPLRSAPAIVPRAGLVRCSRAVRCPVSAARTTARVCCQGVVVAAHTRPQAPDECSRVLYAPVVRLRDLRCTPPTLRSASKATCYKYFYKREHGHPAQSTPPKTQRNSTRCVLWAGRPCSRL